MSDENIVEVHISSLETHKNLDCVVLLAHDEETKTLHPNESATYKLSRGSGMGYRILDADSQDVDSGFFEFWDLYSHFTTDQLKTIQPFHFVARLFGQNSELVVELKVSLNDKTRERRIKKRTKLIKQLLKSIDESSEGSESNSKTSLLKEVSSSKSLDDPDKQSVISNPMNIEASEKISVSRSGSSKDEKNHYGNVLMNKEVEYSGKETEVHGGKGASSSMTDPKGKKNSKFMCFRCC
ncbi:hypothetical protein SteCoe_2563 [Stentor coeruleus]|uniref:Uncharacterized protein n=1 Tax=Stentor coeruleus TaxID=5963 RepID=A0A1R2CZB9_9CILI|nr:hypothetical protein SteCoe_9104 [Stentor coeruleus]OMJ94358.1 hypothetical protein SteCoe_2563 [Stentor coeruleus]